MAKRSFSHFVEQEMGKFPHFLIFAVLEWTLIGLLFLDGLIAFAADRFARLVGLRPPCVVCTRIDHVLIPSQDRDSYLTASLCDSHKTKVSSLTTSDKNNETTSSSSNSCCGCGGEALRRRLVAAAAVAPAPSPRGRLSMRRRGSEIRFDSEVVAGCDQDDKLREDLKAAMLPLLTTEPYETNIIESTKTPIFTRSRSRFLGIQVPESTTNTPRLTSRLSRKIPLEKTELPSETALNTNTPDNNNNIHDNNNINDKGTILEMDSVLAGAKSQANLDPKSLMELYTELDEERSASAVAANNAMAMITRVQAEKAAVQMEALQYQRMMEEQFEYDQEALQEANDLLLKKEEDMSALESELEAYRERFGWLNEDDEDEDEEDRDRDHDDGQHKSSKSSYSSGSLRTEIGSSCLSLLGEEDGTNGGVFVSESLKDLKEEKTYFLGMKKLDMNEVSCENGDACLEFNPETETRSQ